MSTIFIMSGLPFSGKTSLSKVVSKCLEIPRISFDETWLEIEKERGSVPGSDDIEKWKYICEVCEQKAKSLLEQGTSVVYDNLGSTLEQRNKLRNLAIKAKAESKIVYIDISKEEVIYRRERNLSLKERAQVSDENFDNALRQFEPPTKSEKPLIYRPEQEMELWLEKELGRHLAD